jgi:hypothetical protein
LNVSTIPGEAIRTLDVIDPRAEDGDPSEVVGDRLNDCGRSSACRAFDLQAESLVLALPAEVTQGAELPRGGP